MADDIINIDLNVLPKIDKKGLTDLTRQLQSIVGSKNFEFRGFLDSLITPGTFTGLSFGEKQKRNFRDFVQSLSSISSTLEDINQLVPRRQSKARGVTSDNLKSFSNAMKRAQDYINVMRAVANQYHPLLENVNLEDRIYKDILAGRNTHQYNVGASLLANERFRRLDNLNRRYESMGIVSDPFRILTLSGRNASNKTAIIPRAAHAFEAYEEYNKHATKAIYQTLSGQTGALEALGQVGLGVEADGSYGENVDPKIYKAATQMIGAITKGRETAQKLNAGGLDKEERAALLDMHKTQAKIFNKGLKILWGTQEQKEMASAIYASQTALTQPASILQQAIGLIGVGSAVGTIAQTIGGVLEAGWQEDIDRSWQGSVKARNSEIKSTATLGGGVAGGLAGAAIGTVGGFLVGGPAGMVPGAIKGAAIGGGVGAYGASEVGTYLEKRLGANIASINYATGQARNESLYGPGYSTVLAEMINGQGIASREDVSKMAGNALTLRARMMLGLVGENEMLLYSLMPDYYRAAMDDRSQVEIMDAYQRSLLGIGDRSLRAFAGMNVGGGSAGMYALANSPYYADMRMMAGDADEFDYFNRVYGEGLVRAASGREGREYFTARKNREQVARSAGSIDPFVAAPGYAGPTREWLDTEGEALSEKKWYTPAKIASEIMGKIVPSVLSAVPIVNVYLDGSEIGYALEVNRGSERLLNVGSN